MRVVPYRDSAEQWYERQRSSLNLPRQPAILSPVRP